MLVDRQVYTLAESFGSDAEPPLAKDEIQALAEHIQSTIEDALEYIRIKKALAQIPESAQAVKP